MSRDWEAICPWWVPQRSPSGIRFTRAADKTHEEACHMQQIWKSFGHSTNPWLMRKARCSLPLSKNLCVPVYHTIVTWGITRKLASTVYIHHQNLVQLLGDLGKQLIMMLIYPWCHIFVVVLIIWLLFVWDQVFCRWTCFELTMELCVIWNFYIMGGMCSYIQI